MTKSSLSKRKNQLLESKEVVIEESSIHITRQKEMAFQRAKLYMLICLAMLCHMWDRVLTVDRLRSVYIMADPINEETDCLNSKIKPVLKEEASNIALMHSKRFFSPEIKLKHSIVVTKDDSEDNSDRCVPKDPIYTYTRDYRLDRVHLILPYEGDLLKYKQAYFNALLELFPSLHGYVSMWSDRRDSFFSFINSTAVEKYKYKILASLLLLAEGVDVPLVINKGWFATELVLKKADGRKEHFSLNMNVLVKTRKNKGSLDVLKRVFQKRAIDVVNFFIENRENEVFTKGENFSEPFLYKKFEKVQFIDSPRFLIQTYIRHCLESTKEVILFRQIVHDMLNECIEKGKANPEDKQRKKTLAAQAKDLFYRYFISDEQRSNDSQPMGANRRIEETMCDNSIDLLTSPLYLEPVADVVPVQKNIKNSRFSSYVHRISPLDGMSIQKNAESITSSGFTDYGETVLLGLLCWIAYDCEKHMYTVDHIESASEELKGFFQKHKYMYGGVSKEMHDDWNRVVGGLSDPNIQYMLPDRNQLVPGWINMLYVIKEITGMGDTKKIDGFRERLKRIEEEQEIQEVKLIYEKLTEDTKATTGEKDGMELQILGWIDAKRLNEIRILEEALKKEENREGADVIKLKMQKLIDIKALYKSYIEQEEALKYELSNDIREYLKEVIKKDVNVSIILMFKQTFKESCSDALGKLRITRGKNYHCYGFEASFKYNPKVIELECKTTFNMYQELCSLEKKQLGVFERKEIIQTVYELKRKNRSSLNKILQPTLFYDDECKNVDVHLLDPLMHISEYKVYIVWALLLHAIDRNLDSNHPFVRLADNLLESARFMDSRNKNIMFMLLSLISADKYYPHITIDEHAYVNEKCFVKAIEKVLELANKTTLVSHKTYADIITDIMIKLYMFCLENRSYSELESLTCSLNGISEAGALFVKILTLNGTTMKYITRIVQSTQEIEKTYPSDDYKGCINALLIWFIREAEKFQHNHWCDMIKGCYDLIDTTKFKYNNLMDDSSV